MEQSKKYANRFRLYYLLTLMGLCCYDSYISVYLEQYLHMSGTQIGCFIAVSMVAGLVIMPLYGSLGDKTGRYREILMLCTAGSILFAFLLSMQTGFILLIIMGVGFELNRCSILAMADTQAIRYCNSSGQPYGSIRCFGCVGWIAGSALCGFLVRQFGLDNVFARFFMAAMAFSLFSGGFCVFSGISRGKNHCSACPEGDAGRFPYGRSTLISREDQACSRRSVISPSRASSASMRGSFAATDGEGGANTVQLSGCGSIEIGNVPSSSARRIVSSLSSPQSGRMTTNSAAALIVPRLMTVWLATCPTDSPVTIPYRCFRRQTMFAIRIM